MNIMGEKCVISDQHESSVKFLHRCIKTNLSLPPFKVMRLSPNAIFPYKSTLFSAGYDLSSTMKTKVPAQDNILVSTDLIIAVPEGTYAQIAPRSGLTFKYSINVGDYAIDVNYRRPICVMLYNDSDVDFEVNLGDRIAQLLIKDIMMPNDLSLNPKLCKEILHSPPLLKVKRLSSNAILPYRSSHFSTAFDISSVMEIIVPARGRALIPTDLSIAIPEGTYARIAPRFRMTLKYQIHIGAGVVDADYRGPVGVVLFNRSYMDFVVKPGDVIAQLIIQKIVMVELVEVDDLVPIICGPAD